MTKLEILKQVKKEYDATTGLCYSFKLVLYKYYNKLYTYDHIVKNIPEFNPMTLKASAVEGYWWPILDYKSRIKALDYLIELYKNNTEEWDSSC